MLKIENLITGYGRDPVLRGVSFDAPAKAITAVFGHNGAGKSSLVRALIGLLPAWEGSVMLERKELAGTSSRSRVEAGIAVSFQDEAVFPTLTVAQNLRLGAHVRWNDKQFVSSQTEHVLALFPKLRERGDQLAYTLSGGERRMLSIGMALMTDPKIIILDEPSTGLSPSITEFVFDTIASIRSRLGKSIILVEQNVQHALEFADKAVVLKTGVVIFDGPPKSLQDDAELVMMF
jgi:branched-chain amino acid transport system ATP-binding protein